MTRAEFEAAREEFACKHCGGVGMCEASESEGNAVMHSGGRVDCRAPDCGRFQFWLKAEKNTQKRPAVKPGEVDRVWQEYGGVCAVCNLSIAELEVLGIERTRQHVPAYKQAGDGGKLLPFCGWCQARAAAEMARMGKLVERVAKRLSATTDEGEVDDEHAA